MHENYSNQFNSVRINEENNYNSPLIIRKAIRNPPPWLEFQNSISQIINSATGPDEIHYTFLNELPTESLKYHPNICNIFISGNIPTLWKQAANTLILKKQGYPTNPISYRLIASTIFYQRISS